MKMVSNDPIIGSDMEVNIYKQKDAIVMVIDDDDSVLKTTALILEDEGYQIEAFSSGKKAINNFDNNIHAVVLDINMPDMTGLQAFKELKSINPYVPIILHTGTAARHEERRDIRRQFRPTLMSKREILDSSWTL